MVGTLIVPTCSNAIHLEHTLLGRQQQWVKMLSMEKPSWKNGKYTICVIYILYNNTNIFITYSYSEDLELDDAVHTAILTLKEGFEGKMTADNIEVGICDRNGFKRLDPSTVKDYLVNIP